MIYDSEKKIVVHSLEEQPFNQQLEMLLLESLHSDQVSLKEADWTNIYEEIENRLQQTIPEHEKAILTQKYGEDLGSRVVSVTRKPTFIQDVTSHAIHLGKTDFTAMNKFLLAIQKSLGSNVIKSQVIYRFKQPDLCAVYQVLVQGFESYSAFYVELTSSHHSSWLHQERDYMATEFRLLRMLNRQNWDMSITSARPIS